MTIWVVEITSLRQGMGGWRFFQAFRTREEARVRTRSLRHAWQRTRIRPYGSFYPPTIEES